jgi:hypothetical protein
MCHVFFLEFPPTAPSLSSPSRTPSAPEPRLPKPQRITAPRKMRTIPSAHSKRLRRDLFHAEKITGFPQKNAGEILSEIVPKKIPEIFSRLPGIFCTIGGPNHVL